MLLGRPYIVLEHALSASRLSLFETAPGVDGFVSPYHYQPRKILDIALWVSEKRRFMWLMRKGINIIWAWLKLIDPPNRIVYHNLPLKMTKLWMYWYPIRHFEPYPRGRERVQLSCDGCTLRAHFSQAPLWIGAESDPNLIGRETIEYWFLVPAAQRCLTQLEKPHREWWISRFWLCAVIHIFLPCQ